MKTLIDLSALPITTSMDLERVDSEFEKLSLMPNFSKEFSICVNDKYYPPHLRHVQSWF